MEVQGRKNELARIYVNVDPKSTLVSFGGLKNTATEKDPVRVLVAWAASTEILNVSRVLEFWEASIR